MISRICIHLLYSVRIFVSYSLLSFGESTARFSTVWGEGMGTQSPDLFKSPLYFPEQKVGLKEDFQCCSHSETETHWSSPGILENECKCGERRRKKGGARLGSRILMEKDVDLGCERLAVHWGLCGMQKAELTSRAELGAAGRRARRILKVSDLQRVVGSGAMGAWDPWWGGRGCASPSLRDGRSPGGTGRSVCGSNRVIELELMQDGHLGVVLYFYQKLLPAFLEVSVCLVSTSTFLQHETCTGGSQSQMCRGQASDTNEQIRGVSFKQKHTLFTYLFFTYIS